MKKNDMIHLIFYSIKIFLFKRDTPLLATMILTDKCNLSCTHCALSNYHFEDETSYSLKKICKDMRRMYEKGVRILCFSGGEIALWKDGEHLLGEIVDAAKKIGFLYVTLATNGTIDFEYGNADFVLISIDGSKNVHDFIRGESYDRIIGNIRKKASDKIVIFMEINQLNKNEIQSVCKIAKEEQYIKAVSFNFHTPFSGTEDLALSKQEKKQCCNEIVQLMNEGYPILNLKSCFPYLVENNFKKPCRQLMVMDYGEEIICNRCIKEEGLCEQCGYFETAEIALIFSGKIKILLDALWTYRKYL